MSKSPSGLSTSGPLPSQVVPFERLSAWADLFFSSDWHYLSPQPRLHPLILGPSGSGKSWLVRHLGYALSPENPVQMMHLHFGGWLPTGVRVTKGHSLSRVHDFVSSNDRGIILLDEIDKFGLRGSDWSVCIVQELFALLDHRIEIAHERIWTPELCEKLHKRFFIVGCGTWQDLWDKPQKVGFSGTEISIDEGIGASLALQTCIPAELLRRFNARPISLSYLTREDMRQTFAHLRTTVDQELLLGIEEKLNEAVTSKKGIRWIEEFLAERLLEIRAGKQKFNEINF